MHPKSAREENDDRAAQDARDARDAVRATASGSGFALAPAVHACVHGDRIILLDLKRDRYRAVDATLFAESGVAWVGAREPRNPQTSRGQLLLGRLCAAGLSAPISERVALGPPARSWASSDLVGCAAARPAIGLALAWGFLGAMTSAASRLRRRRPDRLVDAVAARRARGLSYCADAANLALAFEAMRPWHPLRRVCLLDSLALIEFLAGAGIAADWVFGVRARPFQAHCWVEAGLLVLNDALEHVGGFTPILRV